LVQLTIIGIRPPRTLPGNDEVLVTLLEAHLLLNEPGRINTIETNLNTSDEARRKEIEQAIQARLGDNYVFGMLTGATDVYGTIQAAQVGFNARLPGAVHGRLHHLNTFRTVVAERRRDIGMLRAVGASRRTIVGIILAESLLQGLVGTLLGMALGYLLAAAALGALAPLMQNMIHLKFGWPLLTPGLVLVTVALGLGVTVLAGLLPAISAGRVTPLEALRPSVVGVSYRRMVGASAILGIVLIAIALLVLFTQMLGC
jgi:putative ABC transport system permease protein